MKSDTHPTLPFCCEFHDEPHQYIIRQLEPTDDHSEYNFTSVTSFIHHYAPVFDEKAILARLSAKTGEPPADIKARWDAKKDYACDFGTRVHANQEAMLLGQPPPQKPQTERERLVMSSGWQAIQDLRSHGWQTFAAEKIVFSMFYRLAGQIDALLVRGRDIMLLDWKTNERIDLDNRYGQHMSYPISHLPDCNYTHYSLQLNIYLRLLLREGYINRDAQVRMVLFHLTPNGYQMYPVPRSADADSLLLDFQDDRWDMVATESQIFVA